MMVMYLKNYLPCGIVGNEVAGGVDGLTVKRYRSHPEIKMNNSSLCA